VAQLFVQLEVAVIGPIPVTVPVVVPVSVAPLTVRVPDVTVVLPQVVPLANVAVLPETGAVMAHVNPPSPLPSIVTPMVPSGFATMIAV
jgi:hypothetical protein